MHIDINVFPLIFYNIRSVAMKIVVHECGRVFCLWLVCYSLIVKFSGTQSVCAIDAGASLFGIYEHLPNPYSSYAYLDVYNQIASV